jgi:hypothetical protein
MGNWSHLTGSLNYMAFSRPSHASATSEQYCNWPWVMPLHRAHVSFITGLIYYCTHLGLSSTASLIVSHPFHLHHSPWWTVELFTNHLYALPRYDISYYGCMYSHFMYYLSRLPCVPKTASWVSCLDYLFAFSPYFLGGSSDWLEDVRSPPLVIQLRRFGLSYLNFIHI